MQNVPAIKELFFHDQPLHVFQYDGKIAFVAQEVGQILDISDASKSIRQSKALEKGVDFDVISTNTPGLTDNLSATYGEQAPKITILYLSGFFLFVLRSNKPIAVPFTRWVIREAIPQGFQKQRIPDLSEKTLVQLVKEERQGSGIARQMLTLHGWIDPLANQQLEFHGGDDE